MTETKILGGGKLFIGFLIGTIWQYRYFGSTETMSQNKTYDTIEHTDTEGAVGAIDLKVKTKDTMTLSFETVDLNHRTLGLAFDGEPTDITQIAGSATGEDVLGVMSGYIYELVNVDISALVVKDETEVTTYTLDTDYTFDATTGTISILENGNITDGDNLKVDYSFADFSGKKIEVLSRCKIENIKFRFISNPQVGKRYKYDFHKINLKMDGDFALKDVENFAKITFTADILKDNTITVGSKFETITEIPINENSC